MTEMSRGVIQKSPSIASGRVAEDQDLEGSKRAGATTIEAAFKNPRRVAPVGRAVHEGVCDVGQSLNTLSVHRLRTPWVEPDDLWSFDGQRSCSSFRGNNCPHMLFVRHSMRELLYNFSNHSHTILIKEFTAVVALDI